MNPDLYVIGEQTDYGTFKTETRNHVLRIFTTLSDAVRERDKHSPGRGILKITSMSAATVEKPK
mgnify:CR=1 FL=1